MILVTRVLPIGAILISLASAAQQPTDLSPADGPFKVTREHVVIDVNADGTFTETIEDEYLLRTQEGVQALTQFSLAYSESLQKGEMVEAYTLKPDGKRIAVAPDQIFTRASPMAAGAPMFDDNKILVAVLSNAAVGDRVGFKAVIHQIKPLIPGQFSEFRSFTRAILTDESVLELSAPAQGFPLAIEAVELDNPAPTESEGRLHWRWSFHNEAIEPADDGLSLDLRGRGPRLVVSSIPDYASLARAYEGRAAEKSAQTEQISALADQVVGSVADRREQARLLYEWVAKNIRYVAINIGTGAIVPHKAEEILANRYGDCKDHVALLQALLSAKGIASSGALIDTGRHFELSGVSALQFNHIITYLPEFGLYADSTARHTPFGVLPFADVGRPVLLTQSGEIRRTPRVTAEANAVRVSAHVKVNDDGSADSDAEVKTSGVYTIGRRAQMAAMTRPDQETAFIRQQFGNNAEGTLDKGDWQTLSDQYSFRSHFNSSNYLSVPGPGAFGMGVLLTGDSVSGLVQPGLPLRHYDYECPSGTFAEETVVELPKSLKILAMPKSAQWHLDGVTFSLTYQKLGPHSVKSTRTLVVDQPSRACRADYYNTLFRPEILKMRGGLRAMVLYQ